MKPKDPSQKCSEDVSSSGNEESGSNHGPGHQEEDEQVEVNSGLKINKIVLA